MTDIVDVNALSLVDAALHYASLGWHVFPLRPGTKDGQLLTSWGNEASKDPTQVRAWWGAWPTANIGISCEPSGLFVVDLDRHAGGADGMAAWEAWCAERAVELPSTWAVDTPTGGRHLYLAAQDGQELRQTAGSLRPGVDTRWNGYAVAAPSVRPEGRYFARCLAAPTPVPSALVEALRRPVAPPREASARPAPVGQVAARVQQLGAELAEAPDGQGNDTAARIAFMVGGYVGAGQIEHEGARDILVAALDGWNYRPGDGPGGMIRTIERQLVEGARSPRPWEAPFRPPAGDGTGGLLLDPFATIPSGSTFNIPVGPAPVEQGDAGASWEPVDLTDVLNGTAVEVVPEIGWRQDRVPLLYRGKEHGVAGEPESGKTWFALLVASQVLLAGGRVTYIDFEDDARTVVGRLLKLGVLADRLRQGGQFRYVRPEVDVPDGKLTELLTFPDGMADLLVLDGYTEGAALSGLDIMTQNDIALWRQKVVKPALTLGCATLVTDHVVKDKDSRGRFAIGAQHKLAGLTGAQFMVEVVDTWGRGLKGRSRVLITKDRNGGLRPKGKPTAAPNHTHIGDLVGDATSGDMTSLLLWPPFEDKAADEWDGGLLAGKPERDIVKHLQPVLEHLRPSLEPLSSNDITREVSGGKAVLLKALEWLSAAGYVAYVLGPRAAKLYTITDQGVRRLVDHTGSTGSEPVLN